MSRFFLTLAIVVATAVGLKAQAPKTDWKSRMQSERIAFLTSEMDLTPEEAQVFWPIYNKAQREKEAAMEANFKAFRELDAFLSGRKTDVDGVAVLDAYLKSNQTQGEIDSKYAKQYLKVLSAEKVGKLFLAEEKFRRNQIHRLNAPRGGVSEKMAPGRQN